ncbi:hypothetical protein ACOMHN_061932 [Nucella lapillus]
MVKPDGPNAAPSPPPPPPPSSENPEPGNEDDPKKVQTTSTTTTTTTTTTPKQPTRPPKASGFAYIFKYVLVGDCGVGKTALLQRFAADTFAETHQYTIGVDFQSKALDLPNGDNVKLQMWDTAGQERYRNITTSYYRGANGVIIVYDVNSKDSFHSVTEWIRETQGYCHDDVVTVVVGTKKDVDPQSEERYGAEELGEFFQGKDIEVGDTDSASILGVYEVSSKTGDGVDQVFQDLTDRLVTLKLNERNPLRGGGKGKISNFGHDTIQLHQSSNKPKSICC